MTRNTLLDKASVSRPVEYWHPAGVRMLIESEFRSGFRWYRNAQPPANG